MSDIHRFDLKSFDAEVQAQADLDRLRAEIKAAEAERDRIRDRARRDGLELARADALEQARADAAPIVDLLRRAAAAIEEKRAEVAVLAERDLVKLAILVATKLVKTELSTGMPVAEENLRRAIELTANRRELKVLLHERDLARIEEYLPELRREFADVRKISLEASPSVEPGGVIVQTREGSVDATIATQLDQIERGLLG
jgi:flagellar assembly protein FliH